jgi:hypothetical protein
MSSMINTALRFIRGPLWIAIFISNWSVHVASAQAPVKIEKKIEVGYFSTQSAEYFEKTVKPLFDEFKGSCKDCEIVNLTPYDEKGLYLEKALVEKLKSDAPEIQFYFFDWNKKMSDPMRPLVSLLNDKIQKGQLVLAPTGQAAEGEPGSALSGTLMGQAKDVVIIGETTGRERMLPQSYFGPEMLTAIYAPKEHSEKGVGPLYFAARWASVWNKRSPDEWLSHFKTKKIKNRKIFLDTTDLLGR